LLAGPPLCVSFRKMNSVANITITVEIVDADFRQDYKIDSDAPLTDLVRRISEEEGFELRTKTGRPIAWTAEGPSWRPGKTELTDLVRTQSLTKIAERFLEEEGNKTPLFSIVLEIPGASEAIGERRAADKLAAIDETLQQRKEERLNDMGDGEDFTMGTAERAALPEPPPAPSPPASPPPPRPVESRIRRASPAKKKKKKKAAAKEGPSQKVLLFAGGAGCLVFVMVAAIVALLLKPEPPPPPVAKPAPVAAPMPVAVPVAPPPKPVEVKEATPAPLEVFFTKGSISRSGASGAAAQLTSFAKEHISLSYTVRQAGAGEHTIALKGRFSVTISDSGGVITTTGGHPISKGAVIGKDTRVNISNLGGAVSVKVGGKRYGPYKVKKSNSFPAWKISIKSGATLHSMKASARAQ
jgi:hypothetical protein